MRKQVLIIGSAGYIGSHLLTQLAVEHDVRGCDTRPSDFTNLHKSGRELTVDELSNFDVVIYLAGFSGREMCAPYDFSRSYEENVVDIRTVAQKLRTSQLLLYASSASVLEGHDAPVDEHCIIHESLLDKYARSMYVRETELRTLSVRSIGFRFGTVIGISPVQRHDLVHLAMVRRALQTGTIPVQNPSCRRGILGIDDLGTCFGQVLQQVESIEGHTIYHLGSFNTSIEAIAHAVSTETGATLLYDAPTVKGDVGFHLDCGAFVARFGSRFTASNASLVSSLVANFAKAHAPCRVCGSTTWVVLDLGRQPLANNNVDEPCVQPTFPLVLSRCKDCHHTQQDFTVPPGQMFSSYQYMSGTSATLCAYFAWLAGAISEATPKSDGRERIVLELACNDGSQLDEFQKRGWTTIGVDPAENLATVARAKGHEVHVKFWGAEPVSIPTPDAIVAQNVCAHVPCPVSFMRACRNAMGSHSQLYIQTSQCNMYQNGEFDTVYHEHLSFFTADSMKRAACMAGLVIVHVEKTPIHGTSYLFTMRRADAERVVVDSTLDGLILEDAPYYRAAFFIGYKQRIFRIRRWVQEMTADLSERGYTIVAFGAAAKGMTLMNFFAIERNIAYIVDDAFMKQGKYTPNSNIIIRPPSVLEEDPRKLAILILAWNFMEEIAGKIAQWRSGMETVLIVPYPQQLVRFLL